MTIQTKYIDTLRSKIARLTRITLTQLVWMIPVLGCGYYIHENLSEWVNMYFDVIAAQKTAAALSARAEILSEPVIMNPSAIAAYIKASLAGMTAATKAYSLASVAGITTSLGKLVLHIGGIILVIYGCLRIRKQYQAETHDTSLVHQVCQEIMPKLEQIQEEIKNLQKK